jgi:hypothetical protein
MTVSLKVRLTKSGTTPKELEQKIKSCKASGVLDAGQEVAKAIRDRITSGRATGPDKIYPNGMPKLMETGGLSQSFVAVPQGESTVVIGSSYNVGRLSTPAIAFHEFEAKKTPHRGAIKPTYSEDMDKAGRKFALRMDSCLGGS